MPIFVSLRLPNSSINSDKQTNKHKKKKNPGVLIYKIHLQIIRLKPVFPAEHVKGAF